MIERVIFLFFETLITCINYSISIGKNILYGHPNKEVLNTLDNSKIYRTDQDETLCLRLKIIN